ncbi:hypothetical protein D3C73_964730 [compost metagenome]
MTWLARLSRRPVLAIDICPELVQEPLRIFTAPLAALAVAWLLTSTRKAPGKSA